MSATSVSLPREPLLARYRSPPGDVDELVAGNGDLRPHWADLARALDGLGAGELARMDTDIRRLLRDDGVTYTVYDQGAAFARPWRLDPVPLVVPAGQWVAIERGMEQRARLLDAVLCDLYGPRRLICDGIVPPEVVYAHLGFLRAGAGVRLPGEHQLIQLATDLARDGQGRACVLNDYVQAPSGAAFALENRLVLSRVLSPLYRDTGVQRLAPFFRRLRATLAGLAPAGVTDPRVVVLTPGSFSETHYEHAHLARQLGYQLVESRDLRVANGRVWLQSVGEPVAVDVILRRVDAWYVDPLAYHPGSQLGVPGLVEVARRGRVSVVNSTGSGVLENPGLQPFLPAACRALLDEDLLLPSVPTWWCGDPADRAYVRDHLDELEIKPISPGRERTVLHPARMTAAARDELWARIEACPEQFTGQQRPAFSTAPCLVDGALQPRPIVLRCFAVASGAGYEVLPGGLTRVAPDVGDRYLTAEQGASSKDTWVVADEAERGGAFWLRSGPPVPADEPVLSPRAAENFFWFGRYAERAETLARLVRGALDLRSEFAGGSNPAGSECLAIMLRAINRLSDGALALAAVVPGTNEPAWSRLDADLRAVLSDGSCFGSLLTTLRRMSVAAEGVRDQLSNDTWLAVSAIDAPLLEMSGPTADAGGDTSAAWARVVGAVLRDLLALAGLATESMVRDPAWHFFNAGRRVERGMQLTQLLDATVVRPGGTATESLVFETVLIGAESIITYRRRYRSQAQLGTLLDLLLQDPDNPRSLRFQLQSLSVDLAAVGRAAIGAGSEDGADVTRERRLCGELVRRLDEMDTDQLARPDLSQDPDLRHGLSAFLRTTRERLASLAEAMAAEHFDPGDYLRPVVAERSLAAGGSGSGSGSSAAGGGSARQEMTG